MGADGGIFGPASAGRAYNSADGGGNQSRRRDGNESCAAGGERI